MRQKNSSVWFPAKRYGYGWGFPVAWQGWVVLAVYLGGVMAVLHWLPPRRFPLIGGAALVLATGVLVLVVRARGEPPRWRWGGD